MLKNYIKLALKVMLRKKYYTILSLAGIGFTIMIITVFATFIDQVIGENSAEPERNRTLILDKVSVYNQGKKEDGFPSIHFLKKYVSDLESTEVISFITNKSYISFSKGKPTGHYLVYTDEHFWEITDFEFLEGRSFNRKEVENGDRVLIINKRTREHFFGDQAATGKELRVYGEKFKVIGVVTSGAAFSRVNADMILPYSMDKNLQGLEGPIQGSYSAMLLARSDNPKQVRSELRAKMRLLTNKISGADSLKAYAFTPLEQFAKSSSFTDQEPEYGKTAISFFIILLLFMLIPAISLINLNLSRIGERAEEIGVRKSFGATSATLVGQLVVENVILTLVGGIIGLALAAYATGLLVHIINTFDPLFKMPADSFIINWRVLALSIFSCLVFGLLSGVYPAWKMSKLNPVYALKGGQNHD
ncbi:ABC transporter permease [Pedobacter sp. SYSU D00535]|uniref:ABC transporter permease n=1 Tax=Pedobacter sp. SYSU D00535 TaxID=2810308 RepID=UPI001A956CDD|nr:ABC transporter permease [Pedobacter sp. SYSU D00535]